jgi:RNA polymerase sigma-70 factor (ECF subfamily)
LTHSEAESSDLTQETFYRWAEKAHQLRDKSKVKSWLFTTLYREFLGRRRHETRFPHVEISSLPGEELSAERELEPSSLDASAVTAALREVEEVYRAPLVLFYLEEHSYKEIAEILDVPIGTVMSRISRGKASLRMRLQDNESRESNLTNVSFKAKGNP